MDLNLISTDDLIDELGKRFDCWIWHASRRDVKEEDIYMARWGGGKPACIGLCELLKLGIREWQREQFEDNKDKEIEI